MTAMTAATLDTLSGGRFRLGLGVSGPQVSEGWHGVRFDKPLARTREYVEIVRMALARETVRHDGTFWTLPLPDGPGKALRLTVHPVRDRHPGLPRGDRPQEPRAHRRDRRRLAGHLLRARARRRAAGARPGRPRAGRQGRSTGLRRRAHRAGRHRRRPSRRAPSPLRHYAALYVGGMGSREQNFYNRLAVEHGLRRGGREGPGPLPRAAAPRRGRGGAVRVHRPDLADRPAGADPRPARTPTPRRASPPCRVASYAGSLDERVAALRTLAEVLDESGLGE